jgi:hypothetical protein
MDLYFVVEWYFKLYLNQEILNSKILQPSAGGKVDMDLRPVYTVDVNGDGWLIFISASHGNDPQYRQKTVAHQ